MKIKMKDGVSICCLTYNQARYVKYTLDGFVAQITDFPVEIIIHDDASTDGTEEILREYKERYPEKIILLTEKNNQYSQGKLIGKNYLYPKVNYKYFCLCEGDDFWCDIHKLQKQYDAMERYTNCSMCVHGIQCINENGIENSKVFPPVDLKEGVLTSDEYLSYEIGESKWLFQTSSFFFRSIYLDEYLNRTPQFINDYKKAGDFSSVLYFMSKGDAYYIKSVMSKYRVQSKGAVGQKLIVNKQFRIDQRRGYIRALSDYNLYTHHRYENYIKKYQLNAEFGCLVDEEKYDELMKEKYAEIYKTQPLKRKIKIQLCSRFKIIEPVYLKIKVFFYKITH